MDDLYMHICFKINFFLIFLQVTIKLLVDFDFSKLFQISYFINILINNELLYFMYG